MPASTIPWKNTAQILHSLWMPVFVAFYLEPSVIIAFFYKSFLSTHWVWLLFLFLFTLKVYLLAGIYGIYTNLAAYKQWTFHFDSFDNSARQNWPWALFALTAPVVVHFLLFGFLRSHGITSFHVAIFLNVPLMWWMAKVFFRKFALEATNLPLRPIKLDRPYALFLVLLFVLHVNLFYISQLPFSGFFDWLRISNFGFQYLHFLSFIYFSSLLVREYPELIQKPAARKLLILVNPLGPGIVEAVASLFIRLYPPIFVVLKALTPKDYEIREFNRIFWNERYYQQDALVAVTCYTSNCPEAYKIAKEFRKRGCKVVMGGPHVSYLVEEALDFCDSVVVGQAEGVWPQVIKDYENGNLKPQYNGAESAANHELVQAELLNSPPKIIKDFLETMRGCKFKCHFCTIPSLSGGRVRNKPVFELVELLKKIRQKYKDVVFIDNNIYSDPGYARELFKAIKPLNINWRSQCTIDIAKNDETLHLAKESGCKGFLFGYEIYDQSQEYKQGGKYSMVDNYLKYSRKIKSQGISIKAHYIFGYDSDTWKSLWGLWKFCWRLWPSMTVISLLTPLPGSALFTDMVAANRIRNLNWRNYSCHSMVVDHPHMNYRLLAWFYPVIYTTFLFSTSRTGLKILLFLILLLTLNIYL